MIFPLMFSPANATLFHGGSQFVNTENVTANLASPGITIPSNFVGFSEELTDVIPGGTPYVGPLFTGSNTSLAGLFGLLGANGFIRIGANGQDTPNNYTSSPPALTSGIATGVNDFLNLLGAGWTISWGLSGKANQGGDNPTWPSPATLAATNTTQMGVILGSIANSRVVFSLVNEPDLYVQSTANSMSTWNTTYASTHAAFPSATYEGLELAGADGSAQAAYSSLTTVGASGLQFLSGHYYPEGSGVTSVASLVGDSKTANFSSAIAVSPHRFRLDETNMSFFQPTSNGITDRLASSTWFLNVSMNLAAQGGLGISIHDFVSIAGATSGGPGTIWANNAFKLLGDGGWGPTPMFSGMFLFSKVEGQVIVPSTLSGLGNVNTISTIGANGNANILVVNDDVLNSIYVNPDQSNSWTTAKVLALVPSTSSNCTDANPTVGGQAIGESGAWTGTTTTIAKGIKVLLPPCSSALIQIQP